ncbi:hypothetical protein [Pontibaca salina]|uniref:Uncharacterized protein n=1 Tax=Pontibaca salina TaxID=2795731 RepID=A0A934M4J4_9RHOB|nr:hypothetical protein [Pontibaca salina]MBI6630974.1 hypothetical protein [Pontibaca salina]
MDEREQISDTAPLAKITISEEALSAIGMTGLPKNWGWFCGDMCYYLAAAHFPRYKYYALIESDVYLPEAGVQPLLSAFETCRADAIAAQLGPTPSPKKYSKGLAALDLDPAWGCIFPLSRISRPLLNEMRTLRREALLKTPRAKLNDEAVLAGAVQRGGFSVARLEDLLPALASKETFDTNPPHLFEAVAADVHERRLYHPVVMFDTVVHRLRTGEKNYTRHRLRKILRAAPKPMRKTLTKEVSDSEGSA